MKKHAKLLAVLGVLVVVLALALAVLTFAPDRQEAPATGPAPTLAPVTASPTPSPTVDASAEAERKLMEGRFIKAMRRAGVFPNADDQALLGAGYQTVQLLQETGSWRETKATWRDTGAGMTDEAAGTLVIVSIAFLCPLEGYPGEISAYE